ncbi:MAG: peroxiredoxin [Granulosicoccus sp.]|nr:peroxiredoxin [Granulosicoccus sp.]
MTIKVGDKLPDATFHKLGEAGPEAITTADIFNGKKVVVFAVPGAFTPTCSNAHLPGFVVKADEIKAKGVDTIVCVAVNDAFVMSAWGQQQNAEHLMMLSDGNAEFAKAIGVDIDLSAPGLGVRSDRYAMVVDDGVVSHFAREQPKELKVSTAEAILEVL